MSEPPWLTVDRGDAPLIVSVPHAGLGIPPDIIPTLASPWLARKDADWHVDELYDFAVGLGATVVRTSISRTVIDVNRPPDGSSLYPGRTTTELCPTRTFDGEALYAADPPSSREIERRRALYHSPYHAALAEESARLRARHAAIVIYDAHSIRSRVPELFDGELPVFNIGTNGGSSCARALALAVQAVCAASGQSCVVDGRFKGGHITRHHGRPEAGIHALQMELACRGYLREPSGAISAANWPVPYDAGYAAGTRLVLERVLGACLEFARSAADTGVTT